MNLTFLVNGKQHGIEIPDFGELDEAMSQLHAEIVEACGELTPASDLESRLYISGIHALVEDCDLDLGEILAIEAG